MGAVLDLFRVLFEPTAVFERIRERPRWLAPLLGIFGLYLIVLVLMQPFTRIVAEAAIQQAVQQRGLSPDQAPKYGPAYMIFGMVFGLIVVTVILLVGTLVLWVNTAMFAGEARFKMLFSVAVTTGILFVLQQIVTVAVLMARGQGAVTGPDDLQPALGLDLLVPDAKGFVGGLLKGINPFAIYGYWLTGLGVSVTHKTSKGTGMTVAFVTFVVMLILGAGLYAIRPGH